MSLGVHDIRTVGGCLAFWREKRRLSLAEVSAACRRIGVALAPPTLSQYETGDIDPPASKIQILALIYRCIPGNLLPPLVPKKPRRRRTTTEAIVSTVSTPQDYLHSVNGIETSSA